MTDPIESVMRPVADSAEQARTQGPLQIELLLKSEPILQAWTPVTKEVNLESNGFIPRRVQGMLKALSENFTDSFWSEFLDKPIQIADECFTTVRLLVCQAILHSHESYFRDRFCDLHSAEAARGSLTGKNLDSYVSMVERAIAFQNIIRAAVKTEPKNKDRETFVISISKMELAKQQDDLVGLVAKALLRDIDIEDFDQQRNLLRVALVHSLCYEARNGDKPRKIKKRAKQFLSFESDQDQYSDLGFIHCQYGHYWLSSVPIKTLLKELDPLELGESNFLSFRRVLYRPGPVKSDWESLQEPNPGQVFDRLIQEHSEVKDPNGDCYKYLSEQINQQIKDEEFSSGKGELYFPISLVEKLLHDASDMFPNQFFPMRIVRQRISDWKAGLEILPLPLKAPTVEELARAAETDDYDDPKLLIARTAASAILNQRIMFGTSSLSVHFECSDADTRRDWKKAVEWVEDKNKHKVLEIYVTQYNSAPVLTAERPLDNEKLEPCLLALDIGGTSIKAAFVHRGKNGKPRYSFVTRFPTATSEQFADACDFARYVKEQLEKRVRQARERGKPELAPGQKLPRHDAISIGWPGAVVGSAGLETVAATSGILRYFKGLSNFIDANTAPKIHALQLRESFASVFDVKLVRLANDGACHIMAHYLEESDWSRIILVAGTGTALGAFAEGKQDPAEILGEAGKLIIDVGVAFPRDDDGFPRGAANEHFSADTISKIIATAQKQEKVDVPEGCNLDALLVGYFMARDDDSQATEGDDNISSQIEDRISRKLDASAGLLMPPNWERDVWKYMRAQLEAKVTAEKLPNEDQSKKQIMAVCRFAAIEAGKRLADLIAVTGDLLGARIAYAAGGPMNGKLGETIRQSACECLGQRYGYDLGSDEHRIRPMALKTAKESDATNNNDAPIGAAKLGLHAIEEYNQRQAKWSLHDELLGAAEGKQLELRQLLQTIHVDLELDDARDYVVRHAAEIGLKKIADDTWLRTRPHC